jgi:hypothetical protein
MSVTEIEVQFSSFGQSPKLTKVFVLFKKNDGISSKEKFILTDVVTIWEGVVTKTYVSLEEYSSPYEMVKDKILSWQPPQQSTTSTSTAATTQSPKPLEDHHPTIFSIESRAADSLVLSIKSRFGHGDVRLADIALTVVSNISMQEMIREFLGSSIQERKEMEHEMALADAQRKSLMEQVQLYCEQLMSTAADRERIQSELMKRFLPILNSKKEKIRELTQRIEALETGQDVEEEDHQVHSGGEEEQEPIDMDYDMLATTRAKHLSPKKSSPAKTNAKAVKSASSTTSRVTEPAKAPVKSPASTTSTHMSDTVKETKQVVAPANKKRSVLSVAEELIEKPSTKLLHAENDKKRSKPEEKNIKEKEATKKEEGNVTEDEFGPLPPGWVITTSKSQPGKICYYNAELKKKQFPRPTFSEVASNAKAVKSTSEKETVNHSKNTPVPNGRPLTRSASLKKQQSNAAVDESDDPVARALKGLF